MTILWEWAWARHGSLGTFCLFDLGVGLWKSGEWVGCRIGLGVGMLIVEWRRGR